ncbi:MAG: hypothetical protein RIG84_01320 [Roseovarius sp.]
MSLVIAGEERIIPLWAEQSDWSGSANWPSISIYARAYNEDGEDPLVVTLSFEAGNWVPGGEEMRITKYSDGQADYKLFGGGDEEDGAISVSLDSHEMSGTTLSLTGSVDGQLGTSENYGRDIDLSEAVTVAGTFAVTLEELEF